jgi:hypothetical protein
MALATVRAASKVETELGTVWITPTDGEHIYVSLTPDRHDEREQANFTVRGVPLRGSAHFYLHNDAQWKIGRVDENEWQRLYHGMSLERRDKWDVKATDNARRKVAEVLTAVVRHWTKGNMDALYWAREADRREKIARRQEKIAELRKEIAGLELEIVKLEEGA